VALSDALADQTTNNATDHALAGLARRLQFVFAAPIEDNLAD
jgi:hypothetical protein